MIKTLITTAAIASMLTAAPVSAHPSEDYYHWENRANECREAKREGRRDGAVAGAIIGGVIGNAAGNNTESTVAGAIIGGVIGSDIGRRRAKQSSQCDERGPYWVYRDTYDNRYYDRQYGFDEHHRRDYRGRNYHARTCHDPRWAEDRWGNPVRVCRDRYGIYRPY